MIFQQAFADLLSCQSGGSGRIPWTAVEQWCDRHEVDDVQREEMHEYLSQMEEVWNAHMRKKYNGTS